MRFEKMFSVLKLVCICLVVTCYAAVPVADYPGISNVDQSIENKNVERTIDITSQIVKISYKITLNHAEKKGIKSYTFLMRESDYNQLAFISAKDSSKKELKLVEDKPGSWGKHHGYTMTFAGNTPTQVVYIETVFTKMLQPHPARIAQSDRQLVRYIGHLYFFSPMYKTLSQKTTVNLASKNVEFYTQLKPVSMSDNAIVYGPYENIPSISDEELIVHYENNSPFLTITRLERIIEISHWGNIAIEETIDVVHTGAILKGSFSRYDFQKDPRGAPSAVKSYKTILPASATGVYYRDTNGNISTSNMKVLKDSVELDLRPRFPLFGGWKTHYTLGYNVPSYEYLFNRGDDFLLKMRVVDHIFDDMVIDEVLVKVILPERCTNIKLITPYSVTKLPDTLHYTYLDTIGRPVISFVKKNVVENHIHDFNLKYNFSMISMLFEPALVIGFLFIIFVAVIFTMRLDFSITKERDVHHHKD